MFFNDPLCGRSHESGVARCDSKLRGYLSHLSLEDVRFKVARKDRATFFGKIGIGTPVQLNVSEQLYAQIRKARKKNVLRSERIPQHQLDRRWHAPP
jgi:hypothetical protein